MGITKASVIDIRKLNSKDVDKTKVFALDTNILYWMHYSRCSLTGHASYQLEDYPNFISELITNGNKLVTTIYNITELLYIIERNEFEIYNLTNPKISKKAFRDILKERNDVKIELETVILQIKELYEIKEFSIDILGIDEFTNNFVNHNCDDFDYLIVKNLISNGVNNIISDDSDLVTMEKITLYTSNNNTISKAKAAKLLIS